jgi:uncharacterized protein YehS (DUF1456 family)
MDNNDVLIRIRYALDIKNTDMVEIFKLSDMSFPKDDVKKLLTKSPVSEEDSVFFKYEEQEDDDSKEIVEHMKCTYAILEGFLNGFIIFKRGRQTPKPGETPRPPRATLNHDNVNNMILKKMKIALSLNSDDMLAILNSAGADISKGELGAIFRKEGHKNYMQCLDKYTRNFLQGLTIKYRD